MKYASGDIIAVRYLLIALLGKGSSGTVWRVRDLQLDIEVALKVLEASHSDRATMVARFAEEAELSTRMLSPHIVRVLDRGIDADGTPFIAFEMLVGEELGERLDREATLPLADCAAVVVQACRALARAHSVGIVHRDIKPQNIFLCEEGGRALIKVLDFGIARGRQSKPPELRRGQPPAHDLAGTPEYMSPEMLLDGKIPDARHDLYALGVVAYRCFTGRLPYAGETLGKLLIALSQTTPRPPSTLRATKKELAESLDAWFQQALARDPDHRFQNASTMAEAFVQVYRPTSRPLLAPTAMPDLSPTPYVPPSVRAPFATLSGIDFDDDEKKPR